MIEKLLPASVACVEVFEDVPTPELFPAEVELVARAVAKRQREFATVRHCARQALASLGVAPAPILPGERGAPQWPDGVVGSLTHCDGYRAAALARAAHVCAIGIDAEPNDVLPDGVAGVIGREEELAGLAELAAAEPHVCWDRLLFSAKEAVYKAWFPLTRRWLDFREASVTLVPDGTFHARLLVPGPTVAGRPLTGFQGRWMAGDGLVVTAIGIRAGDASGA